VIYVYFDKRLKIGDIKSGPAIEGLISAKALGDTGDFLVLSTVGSSDVGRDGVMWTIDVTLPDNCEVGDEFVYVVGQSKYGKIQPIFTNFAYDAKGKAMTEHIFGGGLIKGSINVVPNADYITGDVNNDKLVDSVDASAVMREYAVLSIGGKSIFSDPRQGKAADVNGDSKLDAADASVILAFYANLSGNSPISDIREFIKSRK